MDRNKEVEEAISVASLIFDAVATHTKKMAEGQTGEFQYPMPMTDNDKARLIFEIWQSIEVTERSIATRGSGGMKFQKRDGQATEGQKQAIKKWFDKGILAMNEIVGHTDVNKLTFDEASRVMDYITSNYGKK